MPIYAEARDKKQIFKEAKKKAITRISHISLCFLSSFDNYSDFRTFFSTISFNSVLLPKCSICLSLDWSNALFMQPTRNSYFTSIFTGNNCILTMLLMQLVQRLHFCHFSTYFEIQVVRSGICRLERINSPDVLVFIFNGMPNKCIGHGDDS